uniref:Uncharacterized protein n=1 Tax=Anguilla anguilla TaxID=7936 RepID=A0A0E9W0E0_ANGAN
MCIFATSVMTQNIALSYLALLITNGKKLHKFNGTY